MKTKKILIIYIVTSFIWLSLGLIAIIYFQGLSVLSLSVGMVILALLYYSQNLLKNISTLAVQISLGNLLMSVPTLFCIAIAGIFFWYSGQNQLIHKKIYDVFLVSGLGLAVLTLGFLITLGSQYYRDKDSQ